MYQLRAAHLDARPAAVIRDRVQPDRLAAWLPAALRCVDLELERQRVRPVGPPFVRRMPAGEHTEVEAGYLVSEPIEDSGRVVASGLPGGPAVMALHVQRPEDAAAARSALEAWLGGRGFHPAGPGWECFTEGPRRGSDRATVDVFVPYRWR